MWPQPSDTVIKSPSNVLGTPWAGERVLFIPSQTRPIHALTFIHSIRSQSLVFREGMLTFDVTLYLAVPTPRRSGARLAYHRNVSRQPHIIMHYVSAARGLVVPHRRESQSHLH